MTDFFEASTYRRTIRAWVLYDWANSAFFTTIVAAVFPPFFRSLVRNAGYGETEATAYWAYTTSIALLLIALLGPFLGALSDHTGRKKFWIAFFAGLGVLATGGMAGLHGDHFLVAGGLFILGSIGVSGGNIFYDSLLPHIARDEDMDRISTMGYAIGYLGGGTLLVVNLCMILFPESLGFSDTGQATRFSFLTVALWWALFSIPLFRQVPEPPAVQGGVADGRAAARAWSQLLETLGSIRRYRQLALFLLAFLIYNDGIGTIIKMATAYGDEIGLGINHMIAALVITQFVGIPATFGFGRIAGRIGAKSAILLGLGVYIAISLAAFFMTTSLHFYCLAFLVGLVQGGTQALSRSLYGAIIPRARTAEFYGFFSTSSKVAGITGPLFFGIISQLSGSSRLGILALIAFFVVGGLLLFFVDEEEGKRVARQEDSEVGYV